jgi:hypothetical protein
MREPGSKKRFTGMSPKAMKREWIVHEFVPLQNSENLTLPWIS